MVQTKSFPSGTELLSQIAERIEAWRKSPKKSKRMPEEIWHSVVKLSKEHSISHLAKALRLDYSSLKKRVKTNTQKALSAAKVQPARFIELGFENPSSTPQCTVTMEDGSGAGMQIHLSGKTDLDLYELARTFWNKRQ